MKMNQKGKKVQREKKELESTSRTIRQQKESTSGRRNFIAGGLISGTVLAFAPQLLVGKGGACDTTSIDYYGLGPFYASGAPTRHVIASPEEPGDRLYLNGTVYANDCITPLDNVLLDIWHADTTGCYSRFGNCANPTADDYKLRGIIRTGGEGTFGLETIKPGRYLNGSQYRPSHIHLIVTHPDSTPLVTQLYFEGDPYIPIDAAASRPDAAGRIIPLVQGEGGFYGNVDIILNVEPTSSVREEKDLMSGIQLRQNYPNPVTTSTRIPFSLIEPQMVRIALYDLNGREITTILSEKRSAGSHVVEWKPFTQSGKPVAAGTYVCRLEVSGEFRSRVMTVVE